MLNSHSCASIAVNENQVAAFYNAATGTIELSTIPRKPRGQYMLLWVFDAPAWRAAADYQNKIAMYHAEDGALFQAEKSNGLAPGAHKCEWEAGPPDVA